MSTQRTNSFRPLMALALLMTLNSSLAMGQYQEEYLDSDPIDVNGYISEERRATDQELEQINSELSKQRNAIGLNKEKSKKYKNLSRSTEKLSDATENLIEERKESQKIIDQYNKKIDCLMKKQRNDPACDKYIKHDEVSSRHAAPVKSVSGYNDNYSLAGDIKLLPYMGFANISSTNEDLEAGMNVGLRVEANLSSRFSVGMGLNYMSLKSTDFGGSRNNQYRNGFDYGQYNSYYQGGREVEYTNISLDAYGKFFFSKETRFRPYMGAGFSYNRGDMSYLDDNRNSVDYNVGGIQYIDQFGNENLRNSHFKMMLSGGSEVLFTRNFGMNVELQYSRGFGSGFDSGSNNGPDQRRLEDLGNELVEANIFGIYAGMLVFF